MENRVISPDVALQMLDKGNARYAADTPLHPRLNQDRRTSTAMKGQQPFATVLSCSDSRVPVELLFDSGIGDIFVIRVAGNVVGNSELGSIEYAVGHLATPLLVLMGHTKCGAVSAVLKEGLLPGNLRGLSEKILPAAEQVKKNASGLTGDQLVTEAVKANIWKAIEDTLNSCDLIRNKVEAGALKVVGAMYDIHTGKIEWMGTHPSLVGLQ